MAQCGWEKHYLLCVQQADQGECQVSPGLQVWQGHLGVRSPAPCICTPLAWHSRVGQLSARTITWKRTQGEQKGEDTSAASFPLLVGTEGQAIVVI
jgi:hypothetical protein